MAKMEHDGLANNGRNFGRTSEACSKVSSPHCTSMLQGFVVWLVISLKDKSILDL